MLCVLDLSWDLISKSCVSMDESGAAKCTMTAMMLQNVILWSERNCYGKDLPKLAQIAVNRDILCVKPPVARTTSGSHNAKSCEVVLVFLEPVGKRSLER